MDDITTRLRRAFAAWGLRSLGDDAADEIERLRDAIKYTQPCVDDALHGKRDRWDRSLAVAKDKINAALKVKS